MTDLIEILPNLFYCPHTGKPYNTKGPIQRTCGGYYYVYHKRKSYYYHRLVFEHFYGEIPDGYEIDHVDNNRLNNHISNLQLLSPEDNRRKKKRYKNNTSGATGVSFIEAKGRYRAYYNNNGKFKHIGWFKLLSEAIKQRNITILDQWGYIKGISSLTWGEDVIE